MSESSGSYFMGIGVGILFGIILGAALMRYALAGMTVISDMQDTSQIECASPHGDDQTPSGYDT